MNEAVTVAVVVVVVVQRISAVAIGTSTVVGGGERIK
jgi:hypothetical protein